MKLTFAIAVLALLSLLIAEGCTKNKGFGRLDKDLLQEATSGNYTYYQNGALLPGVAPSPHGSFKLRVNDIAASVLDSAGELPVGVSFPKGSVLVKDIYTNGELVLYSIMKKDPSNTYAGKNWVWAEIKPDGTTPESAEKKGSACINCHSGTPNRDLVRTYDLH